MLYIKNKLTAQENCNLITHIDKEFDWYYKTKGLTDSSIVKKALSNIDGATLLSKNSVETGFGKTVVTDLSTGCKALILAINFPNKVIDFSDVGSNVLDEAIEIGGQHDMQIYLPYTMEVAPTKCNVNFNGKVINAYQLNLIDTVI